MIALYLFVKFFRACVWCLGFMLWITLVWSIWAFAFIAAAVAVVFSRPVAREIIRTTGRIAAFPRWMRAR
jgi:hypothetical protein